MTGGTQYSGKFREVPARLLVASPRMNTSENRIRQESESGQNKGSVRQSQWGGTWARRDTEYGIRTVSFGVWISGNVCMFAAHETRFQLSFPHDKRTSGSNSRVPQKRL